MTTTWHLLAAPYQYDQRKTSAVHCLPALPQRLHGTDKPEVIPCCSKPPDTTDGEH